MREDRGLESDGREELNLWLSSNVAHRVAYLRIREAWRYADRIAALRTPGWMENEAASRPRFKHWHGQLVAAGIVAVMGLIVVSYIWSEPRHRLFPRRSVNSALSGFLMARASSWTQIRVCRLG